MDLPFIYGLDDNKDKMMSRCLLKNLSIKYHTYDRRH